MKMKIVACIAKALQSFHFIPGMHDLRQCRRRISQNSFINKINQSNKAIHFEKQKQIRVGSLLKERRKAMVTMLYPVLCAQNPQEQAQKLISTYEDQSNFNPLSTKKACMLPRMEKPQNFSDLDNKSKLGFSMAKPQKPIEIEK